MDEQDETASAEQEIEIEQELSLEEQLAQLLREHRELDADIDKMQGFTFRDQLDIQRLKKKKLGLKDSIEFLKNQLIPDWNA